jgi:hypothetical protein
MTIDACVQCDFTRRERGAATCALRNGASSSATRVMGSIVIGEFFQAHIDLFRLFLSHHDDIVERIQGLLNAQRKPLEYLQDSARLSRSVEDCFFSLPGLRPSRSRLRGQLQDAHWASGFRPREIAGIRNGLIDPGEMMVRGFYLWQQTRWPGRNGRLRYAETLFNLYVIRSLELLSMRLWDSDASGAGQRLALVQDVLNQLWTIQPPGQPVFVRDARWLIQLAQSPATDDLGAYFDVAKNIAEGLPEDDRIEVHKAGVRMAGGHLRSQIRHYSIKSAVPVDHKSLLLSTRNSNALDFALLIQDLVPLMQAYETARNEGVHDKSVDLAGVICQGISADPDLFVNRVDLLGAYSMIEHLFITTDHEGHTVLTPMGLRHVGRVREYTALIGRLAKPLHDDCLGFRPAAGSYSPYGIIYGFSSDLLEHMALRTLVPDAVTRFGTEDVFADGDLEKLAWVSGWRKLPHLKSEVVELFDYPQQFADDIFDRLERALRAAASGHDGEAVRTGRLFIVSGDNPENTEASQIPELPARYLESSDLQIAAAHKADYRDGLHLLRERREGKYVVSYETAGGWVGVTKDILTERFGAGDDARIVGIPPSAADALTLLYPTLTVRADHMPSPQSPTR